MDIFKDFLSSFLIDGCGLQVCELDKVLINISGDKEEKEYRDKLNNLPCGRNIYFLGGVGDVKGRASDDDARLKNYIYFDFDLRQAHPSITDEEIIQSADVIESALSGDVLLSKWAFIVFTGNGLHLYYLGLEPMSIDKHIFRLGMKELMERVGEVTGFEKELDKACVNIGRIARLPGTVNQKNGAEVRVIKRGGGRIDLRGLVQLGEQALAKEQVGVEREMVAYENKDVYGLINEIPVSRLLCDVKGWTFNGRNFFKENGKAVACFVPKGENFLVHGGTEHLPDKFRGYSSFSLIKELVTGGDKETFAWFREKFPEVAKKDELVKKKTEMKTDYGSQLALISISSLRKRVADEIVRTDSCVYTWGTEDMDFNFPPLERGDFVALAGESGMGKTIFSLHLAMANAMQGLKVLYISLEMSNEAVLCRYARDKAGVTFQEWKNRGGVDRVKISMYKEALEGLPESLQFVEVIGAVPYDTAFIKSLLDRDKFDMVIIDNFGFFEEEGESELERQKNMSRGILDLCRVNKKACIIVIHHYRKAESGKNKPRSPNALMGSAKLWHDVTYLAQIWRDVEKNNNESLFLIQKSRNFGGFYSRKIYYDKGEFIDQYEQKLMGMRKEDVGTIF